LAVALLDLDLVELVVGDRVETLDPGRHVTVGDALDFQLVQATEVGDLLEAEGGVVDQPDGGRLGHQGFCHHQSRPSSCKVRMARHSPEGPATAAGRASSISGNGAYISAPVPIGKRKCDA